MMNGYLSCFLIIFLFILCGCKQNPDHKISENKVYKCPPCNSYCDTLLFHSVGVCHVCGMTLIPKDSLIPLDNYSLEEGQFVNGSTKLSAEIFLPKKKNIQNIGICLVQGSGASGRNNLWSREHAALLASTGYTVLLPDKRGVGSSTGDWRYASYKDLAEDAISSSAYLKKSIAWTTSV